jgi:aminomuconate-semialdehyde/2-hydroxymuconate-6-semialdehyde dehydrogenase
MIVIKNFIAGVFKDANSNRTLDNVNPSIGKVYGTIPDSDASDVHEAIQAAKEAFPAWKNFKRDLIT